jgi:hypothetical protein
MKTSFRAATILLAAAFLCACSSSRRVGVVYRAGDENPPPFLSGPVAEVLTNFNGFSGHVSASFDSDGQPRNKSGDLLGREGRLIFQPTLLIKGKRARTEGGLYFLADQNRHTGYILSEALQGYAPIQLSPGIALPDIESMPKDGPPEDVNGHPTHRRAMDVSLDAGQIGHLTLWQADDLRHFPVRIQWIAPSNSVTVNFSEVRVEYPQQELFRPPDGFTTYPTPVALMNELMTRDANFAKQNQTGEFDEPPKDTRSSNWRGSSPGTPP